MPTIFPCRFLIPKHVAKGGREAILSHFARRDTLPSDVVGLTADGKRMFRGDVLFELKSTFGMPLDFALDKIVNYHGMAVDWPAFIEAARRNGWWDFQTHGVFLHGLEDSGVGKEYVAACNLRFKRYVVAYPHPKLIVKEEAKNAPALRNDREVC